MSRTELEQRMLTVVKNLRPGEVISFGDVAERAGRPGASRAAGRFLSSVNDQTPWWRVVYSDGRLPPCHPTRQAQQLASEGVTVENNRVVRSLSGRFC